MGLVLPCARKDAPSAAITGTVTFGRLVAVDVLATQACPVVAPESLSCTARIERFATNGCGPPLVGYVDSVVGSMRLVDCRLQRPLLSPTGAAFHLVAAPLPKVVFAPN